MRECDLILKGGVTSGVVYPQAIVEIAKTYRFRSLGGTSAGAIGAVMAAAAEYKRQSSADKMDMAGFAEISDLAADLGRSMPTLFQPSRPLVPLFRLLMAVIEKKENQGVTGVLLGAISRTYPVRIAVAFGGGIIGAIYATVTGNIWLGILALVLSLILAVILVGMTIWQSISRDLPKHDFGICTGLSTPDYSEPGLTDWMADHIDRISGNYGPDNTLKDPLTLGQLGDKEITVAAMTTDLSSGRPYRLPLVSRHHLFSEAEFREVFPARVVDYLVHKGRKTNNKFPGLPEDLYWLPTGDDFPVILVARMSLSFPGLIRAIPLYRFDDQLPSGNNSASKIRRCLFSDGGISSNFPIHFFDSLLPSRPTLGISLTSYDEARHENILVHLAQRRRQSTDMPVRNIDTLVKFAGSIFNTAKDWNDTLQSLLPGYSERVVEIRLEQNEGGMNLNMSPEVIEKLVEYGRRAGKRLTEEFDFDEHRFRRAISLLPKLEVALESLSGSYNSRPDGADINALTYAEVLTDYEIKSYKENTPEWRNNVLAKFASDLAEIGANAGEGRSKVSDGVVPPVDARISLTAVSDRVPVSVLQRHGENGEGTQ